MDRCPICRGRLKQAPQCPRCSADLTLAIDTEQNAQGYCQQALLFLQSKQYEKAKEKIQLALFLHNNEFFQKILGFIEQLLQKSKYP